MLTSAKLRTFWYYKVYFMKLYLYVYLHTKFQVSSIILTSFRRGNFAPPTTTTTKRTPQNPTQITAKCVQQILLLETKIE